jgi:hypothetical protein
VAAPSVAQPRLFTRGRTIVVGGCLAASAHSGRPYALYDVFQELGDPRDEMLVVGLALIAAPVMFGWARQWVWVSALLATIDARPVPQRHHRACIAAWSAILVATSVALAATLWWPAGGESAVRLQAWLRSEDGFWETVTALGLFGAAGFFVDAGLRHPRAVPGNARSVRWMLVGMGLLFFFGAGEEISWGQRIFDIATPEGLRSVNVQGELNVHDIGGYWANYVLMLGIFFYLVALPILERLFVDVRGIVAFLGLPVPPLAFVPFGIVATFLGDHPRLMALWPASTWRLSEARETIFGVLMLGLALDQWLVASRDPESPAKRRV